MQTTEIDSWQIAGDSPAAYEEYLVPGFFKPWAEKLVTLSSPAPGSTILDVACGTGIVARTAAAKAGNDTGVTGLDINPQMLNKASEMAEKEGLEIEWKQGDAGQLPFENNRFDHLFCQQAMQFFPEPQQVLLEMQRVLKPRGTLALNILRSIHFNPAYKILADELEEHAGETAGTMMRSPFPDWNQKTIRNMVSEAGFVDLQIHLDIISMLYPSPEEFLRREAASSPLAEEIETMDSERRKKLVTDLNRSLESYTDDQGVVFPMETFMIIAHK
ncbi:methyltransferase domain-containing protein [Rhodohalobacter sp. SW132]|uniref:class I SAM-dependent methyltransferase n=1 Tax=Rhodohalobacter sp. SW132 TaxID=2293433 RepID=UPI000E257E6B|nr:methyltransferase domain-containing protein [Rhodohalobacter sp. SW132]REL39192.1 methyltransferase domain-containing protein [Rhodohalobacter sp. SW132]